MNSKETIFKYFMEPHQCHEEVWIMRAKCSPFDTIINTSYDGCFELAKNQIQEHFKTP
jgi:hypothetical protein